MDETETTPLEVARENLAAAFTEWHRRWTEEPERYQSEAETLAEESDSYGDGAASYLIALLRGEI